MSEISLLMKKITNCLEAGRNRTLKQINLTGTQLDFLAYLYRHRQEEIILADIAAYFGIKHTSVIHVLKNLEEKDYIYKKSSHHNCRCKHIYLTEAGIKIIQCLDYIISSVDEQFFHGISSHDQQLLLSMLEQIYENIHEFKPEEVLIPKTLLNIENTAKESESNER